jgi:hypothetical protein
MTTHGLCINEDTAELYQIHKGMMSRCYDPSHDSYEDYGAKGIEVDPRWHDPVNFVADVYPRPSKGHSLDRVDVYGGYSPENWRWATKEQQMNNRTNTRWLAHDGKRMSVSMWARRTGICRSTIYSRLDLGWSVEKALTTPVQLRKGGKDTDSTG